MRSATLIFDKISRRFRISYNDIYNPYKGILNIYTDGSVSKGTGGWSFIITSNNMILDQKNGKVTTNEYKPTKGIIYSDFAEMFAVREVTKFMMNNSDKFFESESIYIHSDNIYVVKCFNEWLPGWIKKGWVTASGKPVANREIIADINMDLRALGSVKFIHVKGHSGDHFNEMADTLAKEGRFLE